MALRSAFEHKETLRVNPDPARAVWFRTERNQNVFARCRGRIRLERAPARAVARVAASGLYRRRVNGRPEGRGPARSGLERRRFDSLDLTGLLHDGLNTLAAQVIHFGYRTALIPEGPPGFWLELECDGGVVATTDESAWRFSVDPAYSAVAPRRSHNYGPQEVFDARRDEAWREADYDDGEWAPAAPCSRLDPEGRPPWGALVPRGTPPCREETVLPRAIAGVGEVLWQEFSGFHARPWRVDSLAVFLCHDVPEPPRLTRMERPEALLEGGEGGAVVTQPSPLDPGQPEQYCATLILDFGREIDGYGWIDVEGNAGAVVDVAYGEQLTGGRVPPIRQNTHYADRYALREGRQRHEVYDWKGYRYVQLTFRELTRPLVVHGVGATFTSYPVEPRGTFHSSDETIDRIWAVGAYTQQLCMQGHLMDCPWREQQEWLGDGRVQILIVQNAFGDRALPRKFVEDFADSQDEDGLITAVAFRDHYLFDYALWWVQALKDVVVFNHDPALARALLPNVARLFDACPRWEDASGFLGRTPSRAFIDWANVGRTGVCAPFNAIYAISLGAGADLAALVGDEERAREWRGRAERIAERYHDLFWDEGRGFYVDNVEDGARTGRFSRHTQAITALAGLHRVDPTDLLVRAMSDDSLVKTEPFFSFYLLEALARYGLAADALQFIRERWGDMIAQGATTFWEEWQTNGTFRDGRWTPRPRSHCHAWSAAPTAWLSRYALGVRVDTPGGPIAIEPNPCGLARATGATPTPYGVVTIEWETAEDGLTVRAEVPGEAEVVPRAPAGWEDRCRFEIRRVARADALEADPVQ